MKGQIWDAWVRARPKATIRLRWSDIAFTLIPAVFWLGSLYARSWVITPHCAEHPDQCTVASLLPMDRPAVALEAGKADGLSYTTQGLSGMIALSVPPLWHFGTLVLGYATPQSALIAIGTDLVLFAQTSTWNGFLTEATHLVSQRGRPFVYADPVRAHDFSNYTSFYSGHTSFSGASMTYLTLTLAGRGAPAWVVGVAAATAYGLISLTGLYRVLAGRHFPTDVLAGALAGILVGWFVAMRHRTRE